MDATISNFRTLFPEFSSVDDAKVTFALELASEVHGCSENAQLFLAAHFIALDLAEGVGDESTSTGDIDTNGTGFAESQKVGDISVKYTTPEKSEDAEFMRTSYGRRFLSLRDAAKKKLTLRIV